MRKLILIFVLALVSSFAFDRPSAAAPRSLAKPVAATFPAGPLIERKVAFWESIFMEYSSRQAIVHDLNQPHLILDVLPYAKGKQRIADFPKAYESVLRDFSRMGEKARHKSSLHKRVWKLYRQDDKALSRLLSGRARLRSQQGLSDIFHAAALRAQKHLPSLEKIFAEHGLPIEITRLPFVESMFQTEIRSKVGAAGLWQLMPAAAKPHIVVNKRKDERDAPIKGTYAAAKIMKANYKRLGNWPLAITAYNHGVNGVARGVKKIGSDQLPDLILAYESRSFGFASKNFYAEFLAAKRSYAKWEKAQRSKNADRNKSVALAGRDK